MLNRFVGRDKIIWGAWDGDLPHEYFDVRFDLVDTTEDGLHPGIKAHKQYAERLKKIINEKFEVYKTGTSRAYEATKISKTV
tara:strand:+ start:38 stop:283 length:246 start_codon:yes stop_codon:yes gene_type:complete